MSLCEDEILDYIKSDLLPERFHISDQGLDCTEFGAGHQVALSSTGGTPVDVLMETTDNSHFIPWRRKLHAPLKHW